MDDARLERYFDRIQEQFERIDQRFERIDQRFQQMHAEQVAFRSEVNARFDAVHFEMNERFLSVLDRLDLVEHRVDKMTVAVDELRAKVTKAEAGAHVLTTQLGADVATVRNEVYKLDGRFDQMQMSINSLSDGRPSLIALRVLSFHGHKSTLPGSAGRYYSRRMGPVYGVIAERYDARSSADTSSGGTNL